MLVPTACDWRVCASRYAARDRLRLPELARLLLGDQPLDLAVERAEQLLALRELRLQRALLGLALRDEAPDLRLLLLELARVQLDRRPCSVITCSITCASSDETLSSVSIRFSTSVRLRAPRITSSGELSPFVYSVTSRFAIVCWLDCRFCFAIAELAPVLLDLRLDVVELEVREVEPLVRAAEAGVQLADLGEHPLRLGLLGRDRARGRERRDCDEESRKNPEKHVRPHVRVWG